MITSAQSGHRSESSVQLELREQATEGWQRAHPLLWPLDLAPSVRPPSPIPLPLLHSPCFLRPLICSGVFHLTNKKQNNLFSPQICRFLEVLFIFSFSLTVKLLLKVVFISLTYPTVYSLLSLLGLCRNCYL